MYKKSFHYAVKILAVSIRQRQPQPDGHTSRFSNHCFKCFVWPPCPQTMQQLADPLTDTWHMIQFNENFLQLLQVQCFAGFKQFLQSVKNSTPLCDSGGPHMYFRTSARLYRRPHRWSISAYDNLKYSYRDTVPLFFGKHFPFSFKWRLSNDVDLMVFNEGKTQSSGGTSVGGIVW